MPSLHISDLDGTLLTPSVTLSPVSRETLNVLISKGLSFTVATARTIASAARILQGLDLRLPLILMNGVLIWSPLTRSYEVVNRLTPDLARRVIDLITSKGLSPFMYTVTDGEMHTFFQSLQGPAMTAFYEERRQKYYKTFTRVPDLSPVCGNTVYFTLLDRRERLQPLYDALRTIPGLGLTWYGDIYDTSQWYLEIFSDKASKEQGVRYLREKYGFRHVTAFGDNLNDLSLFKASDLPIAVQNAVPELKARARIIIPPNTEDGVARYLRTIHPHL